MTTNKRKKRKKSSFIKYFILFLLFFSLFVAQRYFKESLGPMSVENPKEFNIEIPSGSSTSRIGDILIDNGLINNKLIFTYQVKTLKADGKLKAGNFKLSTAMNLEEIIGEISKSVKSQAVVRFTIPEGYEVKQIAERLEKEEIVNKDRFLELAENKNNFEGKFAFLKQLDEGQSLEGFLFPSTYEIYVDSTEEEVIGKMLAAFEKVYNKDILPNMDRLNLTLNEIITMASIVEREGKVDEERPIMAGVFYNRIDQNMPLQSCATVQYILGERKLVLSNADTQIESPYNTYINSGLPPGPIASPGEESLIAAVNPADVDYLFFVLTGSDGSHTFTKTYKDHLNAKPKN